jgi:hypothetical protein
MFSFSLKTQRDVTCKNMNNVLAYFANLFKLILQKDTVVASMSVGLAVHGL